MVYGLSGGTRTRAALRRRQAGRPIGLRTAPGAATKFRRGLSFGLGLGLVVPASAQASSAIDAPAAARLSLSYEWSDRIDRASSTGESYEKRNAFEALATADAEPSSRRPAALDRPNMVDERDQAQAERRPPRKLASDWRLQIEPMAWFPSLNGDLIVTPGDRFNIDAISLSELRVAPAVQVAYRRERWTVMGDAHWFEFESDAASDRPLVLAGENIARGDVVESDIRYAGGTLALGYRLWDLPIDYAGRPDDATRFNVPPFGTHVSLDLYGGARLYYFDLQLQTDDGLELVDTSSTWVDPIVGARLAVDLPRGFGFDVASDFGGFTLGSDFAWNIEVGFTYHLADSIAAEIGFRHMQTDYTGNDDLDWDITLAGLFGSVVFRY